MLELAAPLWLTGLLGLPLIRWLHRFSSGARPVAVSALFLWRAAPGVESSGRKAGRPDPRWRLRALVAAVLLLALAGPRIAPAPAPFIDIWIDDSLSMQTRERGRTRLDAAFDALASALQGSGAREARLHSLIDPAAKIAWRRGAGLSGSWSARDPSGAARPRPPAPALLDRSHEHWLVTDGADGDLNAWADKAPLSRVIRTGTGRDNAAVTLLAVRPGRDAEDSAEALITAHNRGARVETRTLSLYAGELLVHRETLRLAPGGQREVRATLPAGGHRPLRATLTPPDDLALDDTLELEVSGLAPVPTHLDETCATHLKTALRAHPRLAITRSAHAPAALRVTCAASGAPPDMPTLRIHPQHRPAALRAPPAWSPAGAPLDWPALRPEWLYADPAPAAPGAARMLLGAAGQPLVTVADTTPRVVEVFLDLAHPAIVREPEYLALIEGLIATALGRSLLDEILSTERAAAESDIAPKAPPAAAPPRARTLAGGAPTDLGRYAALLAALLLIADLLVTGGRARGALDQGGA